MKKILYSLILLSASAALFAQPRPDERPQSTTCLKNGTANGRKFRERRLKKTEFCTKSIFRFIFWRKKASNREAK